MGAPLGNRQSKLGGALGGRPKSYRPEFADKVTRLCKVGASESEIAHVFGVSTMTLWRWREQYPEFATAFRVAREQMSDRIEASLAHRAVGYTFDSEKIVVAKGEVVRVPIKEHIPPDVAAQQFWLTNRRRGEWRNRQEIEVGGPGEFERLSDEELRRFIEADALEPLNGAAPAPVAPSGIAARKDERPAALQVKQTKLAKRLTPAKLNAWD
jgi:transposase-like protein